MTVTSGKSGTIAYNQSGFELWSSPGTGDKIVITIPDSDIITTSENTLYFLHPNGKYLWKFMTSNNIRDFSSTPDAYYIVVGNEAGDVYLFNKSGKVLWKYNAGDWINSVSVSSDGSIIAAGGNNKKVYVFNKDGRLLWDYSTGGWVKSVAISTDGSSLVVGSDRVYYFSLHQAQPLSIATPEITKEIPVATLTTQVPIHTQTVETITSPLSSTTRPIETTPQKPVLGCSVLIALGIFFAWIISRK
jgi:WD40 repeat protein